MSRRIHRPGLSRGVKAAARRAVQRYGCKPQVVALALSELRRLRQDDCGLVSLGALLQRWSVLTPAAALDLDRLEATCLVGPYARTYKGLRRLTAAL